MSLKSEQDVIREVANIASLRFGSGSLGSVAAAAKGSPAGMGSLHARGAGAQGSDTGGSAPMAAQTLNCHSGQYTVESFTGQVTLPLFTVTKTFDYSVSDYSACRFNEIDYSHTQSGRTEDGDDSLYSAGTAQDPEHGYVVVGNGGTPLTMIDDFGDGFVLTTKIRGRSETRQVEGLSHELRDVLQFDFSFGAGGQNARIGIDLGEPGYPLVVLTSFDTVPQRMSIDGPLSYATDFCEGDGRVEYDTLQDLTFHDDGYVNAGQVLITAGSRSVLVTFQADGDVEYQFNDGAAGLIPLASLNSGGECLLVP